MEILRYCSFTLYSSFGYKLKGPLYVP